MSTKNYRPRHKSGASVGRSFNGRKAIDDLYMATDDWRNYRARFLAENGRCYACGARATVVDHVTPHLGDVALFEKLDNHIPLCDTCHGRVTVFFDRKYRKGTVPEKKLQWLSDSRKKLDLTFRVKVLPSYRARGQ